MATPEPRIPPVVSNFIAFLTASIIISATLFHVEGFNIAANYEWGEMVGTILYNFVLVLAVLHVVSIAINWAQLSDKTRGIIEPTDLYVKHYGVDVALHEFKFKPLRFVAAGLIPSLFLVSAGWFFILSLFILASLFAHAVRSIRYNYVKTHFV